MEIHQLGAISLPYDPTKETVTVSETVDIVQTEKEKEYSDLVKKEKNKKMLMTAGAVAGVALLYYLWKKSKK